MNINRRSILMMSGAVAMAFFIGALMPAGTILNANQISEANSVTGYVVVSVMRDGQEIYHHEDHNQITEAGVAFFAQKISDTGTGTADFIGLSNSTVFVPDDDNSTAISGEITVGGLERAAAATFTNNDGASTDDNDDDYSISHTFTSTGTHTGVQGAGLFTDATVGSDVLIAANTFTSVTLQNNDTITITWTIDFGPSGFDTGF